MIEQECKKRDVAYLELRDHVKALGQPCEQNASKVRDTPTPQQDRQQSSIHDRVQTLEKALLYTGRTSLADKDQFPAELAELTTKLSHLQGQIMDERVSREEQIRELQEFLQRPSDREGKLMDLVALQQDAMNKVQHLVNEEKSIRDIQHETLSERVDKLESCRRIIVPDERNNECKFSQEPPSKPGKAQSLSVPAAPRITHSASLNALRPVPVTSASQEKVERNISEIVNPVAQRLAELSSAAAHPRSAPQSFVASPPAPVPMIRHPSPAPRSPPVPLLSPPVPLRVVPVPTIRTSGDLFEHLEKPAAGSFTAAPAGSFTAAPADVRVAMPRNSPSKTDLHACPTVATNSTPCAGPPPRAAICQKPFPQTTSGLKSTATVSPPRSAGSDITLLVPPPRSAGTTRLTRL